jgi:hypothetical protein
MLTFIQNPDFKTACKDLSTFVRNFERSRLKRQNGTPAFMERSFIPRPESEASLIHQCLSTMELRRLNVISAKVALGQNFKTTPWITQLWKLLSVLEEMEQLASIQQY